MSTVSQTKPNIKTVCKEDYSALIKFMTGETLPKSELTSIVEEYYGVSDYNEYMDRISEAKYILKYSNIYCNDFCIVVESPIILRQLVPYILRLINITFKGERIIFINGGLAYRPFNKNFNKKKLFKKLKVVKKSDKVTTAMRLFYKNKGGAIDYVLSIAKPFK